MEPSIQIKEINQEPRDRIDQLETEKAQLQTLLKDAILINQLKSDFLAKASHDLRSPLTNIQLSASLIEHYYERLDRDKIFGHLAKIKDEVNNFVLVLNAYLLCEQNEQVDGDRQHSLNVQHHINS